ncbi:Fic family protein [Paraburkholderia pallida]|uniref:Fic family protein n=1 Tax=Paraburkholderia pallida TaxID=2547399 RepID=A0A4P7CNF8_9BURK|nr:Fic family protein [Paraburkholderia pallida]QBQ95714.1 Fic family protein [Paraburkholderia pallida]
MAEDWVGYRWLSERYNARPVQPQPVESDIGATRRTTRHNGTVRETYTAAMRPADTLSAHLTFALKHEGVFLEQLARLFNVIPEGEIRAWVLAERTGQYARRAGFLYEWLTGRLLDGVPAVTNGGYVDAIDSADYVVATAPGNNTRWRVRDNLPGSREFCVTVRRTDIARKAENYDCGAQLDALQVEYGADVLRRSAVWLTLKESRASFQIEHEQDKTDRIKRFAAVMETRIGAWANPLEFGTLTGLQREIIGDLTTLKHFGLRQSPVFVGATDHFRDVIHYIAPHWKDVSGMLDGLAAFLTRTAGASPIARAAAVSFGFVYIHPLADGNGRVHRFLINDILRRDNAVPRPFVLPISAAITSKAQHLAAYDQVLEVLSRPLMQRYERCAGFGAYREFEDGAKSNFTFGAYDDAAFTWRYLDLTAHVEYLAGLIDRTIRTEMRQEAELIRNWDRARFLVKEVLDGPNADIDRIIRSVRDNHWSVSGKLSREFPIIEEANLGGAIVRAVREAFDTPEEPEPPAPSGEPR